MRWMLLVVVASAISVACRAALCELRRGARPPPAPPGRAHTSYRAHRRGRRARLSRAPGHTPHTHMHMHMCMCM